MRPWLYVMAGVCVIPITFFYVYPDFLKPHKLFAVDYRNYSNIFKDNGITSPVVLLWTPYFSQSGKWLPSPAALNCPVSDCVITDDRNLLPTSSAIVLDSRNTDLNDLPKYRTPFQRWILFNLEAPPHSPRNVFERLAWNINWTATYRSDSDIQAYYGWVSPRKIPAKIPTPPANRKLVCWLVSNCHTPSRREEFVKKLTMFIPVDIYGSCGNLRCPNQDGLGCYKKLSGKYKFYLSFENSICKDYVTEKLFNALSTNMVPVVMGGGNYSKILPPNSYIDALSFDGPRQLADYLLELDKDEQKYLSFLAWKKDYEVVDGAYRWVCDLCQKLHLPVTNSNILVDLRHWWFEEAKCFSWQIHK